MKKKREISTIALGMITTVLALLISNSAIGQEPSQERDFGAYYTQLLTGADWELYDRTGDYSDIIIDLGSGKGKFVFWRGASYLPYFENASGKQFFVDEIIERKGDGEGLMPDKVNTYSRIALIESSDEKAIVHWRYLPEFSGSNPHKGVKAINFVDEYFTIYPDGKVIRSIKKGTQKIDAWKDAGNQIVQEFSLKGTGIQLTKQTEASTSEKQNKTKGVDIIDKTIVEPVAWFKFDEAVGNTTSDSYGDGKSVIAGDKTVWKKGISGTALQYDGYKTIVKIPNESAPKPSEEITLEGWIVIGAYPWSWCPLIQQANDVPEEVRLFRGEYDITDLEKREGDLSIGLIGGDPDNIEGDGEIEEVEIDFDEIEFHVKYQKEDDTGYFFGIDAHGHPGFNLRVGGVWEELTTDFQLKRKKWYHLTATYSKSSGEMIIYVNGNKVANRKVAQATIELSEKDIQIGQGKDRRPSDPVRENTFTGTYALDGLVDEVKLYDVALSEKEIKETYSLYNKDMTPDMEKRVLPNGESRDTFGAYYTNLKFYDNWDNMWRTSEHSDVVVEFDDNPSKFIFWKGVSYIPMMVNENNFWYSNEFNETWSTSGGQGCQEPMSDKECYYNHARIIENTPARVVVHYRFPLVDVNKYKANYVEETGWYDIADWYYYIYPDGVAAKVEHLWTSGNRDHEWQESMAIFGPDQHPHDLIERKATFTMARIDGEHKVYNWDPLPPDGIDDVEGANIHHVNYKGEYDPVTIVDDIIWSNVYGGEITDYAIFPTWNHWPVAQMPSDGRYASYPDRTCHSSLSHIFPPDYDEQFGSRPYQVKLFMEGMLNQKPLDLIPLAKSWLQAPKLSKVKGCTGKYDKPQRAYVLETESDSISMTILANEDKPVENLCLVFKHWNSKKEAAIHVDGSEIENKQGIVRDTDGSYKLLVWIPKSASEPFNLTINRP